MTKQYGISVCALLSVAALALPCVAQQNPWNGSWKIDHSTLKYDGPTVSVVADADGFTVTRGGKAGPKVVCDGKPNAPDNGVTTDVTPPDGSPFTITTTSKRISGGPGFSGTWKETGFTESQDTGVLTIEVKGDSVDFKETDNDKPITCKLDGTPTTVSGTRTMSVKQDGPRTLKVTYSNDGKVSRENTFVLSADGKTVKETDITPAPSPSTMSVMFHKS
jgi:hypothetical protein